MLFSAGYRLSRKIIGRWKRQAAREWSLRKGTKDELLEFRCNICGKPTSFRSNQLAREPWSCAWCGSNVRWRSVIHALSMELFGRSLAISDFPARPDLIGIGLSDWDGYATRLKQKLGYTNTFYHQNPILDITSVGSDRFGRYDFVISSDVFEHIAPPISIAFENARRMLRPSGVMILTVPCVEGETKEHFPELHKYRVRRAGKRWILLNETVDGRRQEFTDVTFHGGPGTVLEMRLFGKQGLMREARAAGYGEVKIYDAEYPPAGIRWLPYIAEYAPYRPLIYGLDSPPWALRNTSRRELESSVCSR
jgi:SAM-dependent methyltransferase